MTSTLRNTLAGLVVAGTVWGASALSAETEMVTKTIALPEIENTAPLAATSASVVSIANTSAASQSWTRYHEDEDQADPVTKNSSIMKLTLEQEVLLAKAKVIGEKIGLPETLQVLLLQETWGGKFSMTSSDGLSYGVLQIKPSTAKYITEKHQTDLVLEDKGSLEDYKQALLTDHDYSLKVGAAYVDMLYKMTDKDWKRTVVSYNWGPTGARKLSDSQIKSTNYYQEVAEKMKVVRDFNAKTLEKQAEIDAGQTVVNGKFYAVPVAEPAGEAPSVNESLATFRELKKADSIKVALK